MVLINEKNKESVSDITRFIDGVLLSGALLENYFLEFIIYAVWIE